ncbi:MAG: ammonium transporter [Methanoregula sp.]|jgi:Amt family ammonium transporter|uniref:ammonium transporter n=1 Tax=Methanoregula sp. TaxID=2052170 RepID=UPI003D11B13D
MVADGSSTIAWLITATALVMLMTPGVGFFYGGLVRKKNFISMISLSFIAFALVSIQWILVGYTFAFGQDAGGIIGNLGNLGLNGVGMTTGNAGYPPLLYMIFQLTFAAVTVAIVTSGLAERVKLSSFIIFTLLWTTFVYDPIAHWVWGGGWLASLGAIDFAGGMVVHISAGFAALALALVIGKRAGYGQYSMEPHNIPMTLLGAGLLWFGWFGFNGGSALAANGMAVNAIVVTNTAAAAGALSWMVVSWINGKPSSLGMVTGAVAGLGTITPMAGYVTPLTAILIGAIAGILCYKAMLWRIKSGMDESLDAWAVHGVGGFFGTVCTGIFATTAVCSYSGLLEGNVHQFTANVIGAVVVTVYAFVVTYILAIGIDRTIGLRVSEEEEYVGLDLSQHGESCR